MSAVVAVALVSATGLASAGSGKVDADSLYRRAMEHLGSRAPDERRLGLAELEEAAVEAGPRTDILDAIARVYAAMGHHAEARRCLDRVTRLAPHDAEAQLRLGVLWKWEWLSSLEPTSYAKAVRYVMKAAELGPKALEPRLELTGLALAKNNLTLGMLAARSAIACDREAVEAELALACASYRAGQVARADSVLGEALPRLPATLRARFTDLSGISFNARPRPLSVEAADSLATSFWGAEDPDLTTPENEAQIDFLTRVAHAVLLFRDEQGVRWDMRAELFARYGIPAKIELPPPPGIDQDVFTWLRFAPLRMTNVVTIGFPYHQQTWIYPELGMRVELWDRSLRESYGLPVTYAHEADPRAWLADARPDLVVLADGRGVYRALPPGVNAMPARALITEFPSDSGARLVAHLEVEGSPTDKLTGSWAVADADGRVVARASGALSVSACGPGSKCVAQFDAVVAPGDYRVHLSVDDRRGRRGIVRLTHRVAPPTSGLAVSDLVLVCGSPPGAESAEPVRIDPDFDGRSIDSRTVTAYFEIDHLAMDAGGVSHFGYRYSLRELDRDGKVDRKVAPILSVAREEEHLGSLRRQFVTATIPSLAPGAYDFEVEIHDLGSGATATRAIRLVK